MNAKPVISQAQSRSSAIPVNDWLLDVGQALKKQRQKQNKSQSEISRQLGVGRSIISNIENGRHDGSLKPVIAYLQLFRLKLSVESIYGGIPQTGDNRIFEDG